MKRLPLPLPAILAAVLLAPEVDLPAAPAHSHKNPIPPRLQWEANGGYCGETSLISAGLFYGQYLSQYDARICAIGRTPQNKGELLLGENDGLAAARMHLKAIEWKGRTQTSTAQFLRWVKRQVLNGYPVIIGIYDNADLLGTPGVTDPQYDHIVPVGRVRSRHSFNSRKFFGSDRITFSDNGLFGTPRDTPYLYTYTFAAFPADRGRSEWEKWPPLRLARRGAQLRRRHHRSHGCRP